MNLLIVSPKFHPVIGGGETFVLNEARRLHEAGIHITVAAEPHPGRNFRDYPFAVRELKGLSDASLDALQATAQLHTLIATCRPDIIHVHGYFGLLAVGLANSKDIPIIASIHSTPVWGERIVGGTENFAAELSFARRIVSLAKPRLLTAANDVYAEAAEKVAERTTTVTVMPYPVDDRSFYQPALRHRFRDEFGLGARDILVTVPSRIIERKGIREAVEAITLLPDNVYLCVPGAFEPLDAAYWQSVQGSDAYRHVSGRVIVPGQKLIYADMPALYAATDIVVMPSYYEGAPVATVEAMASGTPFIGADSQGINGFIRHGENGLLVPKGATVELADAILRLIQDKAYGNRLAARARKDIRHLSWDVQLPAVLNTLQSVIATKSVHPATGTRTT